eukprot:TRINITY_DN23014_c0_g1_i1.p1 TRINITY_DN23014_c0_g1~~TRINITY_DN23014_c0_g1_i1.p1  ORF type:complete len:1356 (-),score=400.47 TRINITY_DN23014_c0_g1_i1:241-4191(-)
MKNLVLVEERGGCLPSIKGADDPIVKVLTLSSDCVCLVSLKGKLHFLGLSGGSLVQKGVFDTCSVGDEGLEAGAVIADASYLQSEERICVVSHDGDIVFIDNVRDDADGMELECDVVGSLDAEIISMGWNPEEETCVFVTAKKSAIIMKELEIVTEVDFHSEESISSSSSMSMWTSASISWRFDGTSFVVCGGHSGRGERERVGEMFVVSESGKIEARCEKRDGMADICSWRPNGSLISVGCHCLQKEEWGILLVERNGLVHDEFSVPIATLQGSDASMKKGSVASLSSVWKLQRMEWDASSEFLAIHFDLFDGVSEENVPRASIVQVWTRRNYHWYLKYSIPVGNRSGIQSFCWGHNGMKRIWLVQGNRIVRCFDFDSKYEVSDGEDMCENPHMVSVIDGLHVKVTPLRKKIVPPPMCDADISLDGTVLAVSSSNDGRIAVMHSGDKISLLSSESGSFRGQKTVSLMENDVFRRSVQLGTKPLPRFFTLLPNGYVLFFSMCLINSSVSEGSEDEDCGDGEDEREMQDMLFAWKSGDSDDASSENVCTVLVPKRIVSANVDMADKTIGIQDEEGIVWRSGLDLKASSFKKMFTLSVPCSKMLSITLHGDQHAICLSSKGHLFFDGTLLLRNCTSYFLHDEFLLATTSKHMLVMIPLYLSAEEMKNLCQQDMVEGKFSMHYREVERGASLVSAITFDTRAVLQMPRGNLEVVNPRPLVLCVLHHMINDKKYREAFVLAKKHKVDLNILIDHSHSLFVENVSAFVDSLGNAEDIGLFITQIRDEDVTKDVFEHYRHPDEEPNPEISGKTNAMCRLLREVLVEKSRETFIIPILYSYVRCEPPELENALSEVRRIAHEKSEPLAVKCISRLMHLVNINTLYDVALGMYDLDLAHMVGLQTQKDPKEYRPFLNELRHMEQESMKYAIDMHLERWEKALEDLIPLKMEDKVEKVMKLVRQHNLHVKALHGFSEDVPIRNVLMKDLAQRLMEKKDFKKACECFIACDEWSSALEAAMQAGDVSRWVSIVSRKELGMTKSMKRKHIMDFVPILCDQSQFDAAGELLAYQCEFYEESVELLTKHHRWETAMYICSHADRMDLVETEIQGSVFSAARSWLDRLIEWHSQLESGMQRLEKLRQERPRLPDGSIAMFSQQEGMLVSEGREYDGMVDDAFSDTSSVYTSSTQSSRSSRYSKKRLRRLKAKKGPEFEEEHLAMSMRTLLPCESVQKEIHEILRMLLLFKGGEILAQELQYAFDEHEVFSKSFEHSLSQPITPVIPPGLPIELAQTLPELRVRDMSDTRDVYGTFEWKLASLKDKVHTTK